MKPLVTDELWTMMVPLLPPRRPQPEGGRPCVDDRATPKGVLDVLRSGIPWRMLHQLMLERLAAARRIDWTRAANVHDSRMLEPMLDAVVPVRTGRRGRPRRRPDNLHADKGYDYRRCRDACVQRGVKHRIARKGEESKHPLGRGQWRVERTFAWLTRYRRRTIGYERLVCMREAFVHLARALACWNHVLKFWRAPG